MRLPRRVFQRLFVAAVLVVISSTSSVVNALYPDDHWSYSTKLTKSNYAEKIQAGIDADKTVFAPAWNAVTKLFAGNPDITFMDVNLSEESIREGPNGEPYNPGAGGWPTVRYFNKETGIAGGSYVQKTSGKICDELGKEDNMVNYVEEYGKTSLCAADTLKGCSEREKEYITKMTAKTAAETKKELFRLEKMATASMKPSLTMWLNQRKKILKQLVPAEEDGFEDEL